MNRPDTQTEQPDTTAAVLTKALLRSVEDLGLTNAVVSRVLGVSNSHVSRILSGKAQLAIGTKQAEFAALLISVNRSLHALVGENQHHRHLWMHGFNQAFNEAPSDAIQRADGLVRVVQYLNCVRALN